MGNACLRMPRIRQRRRDACAPPGLTGNGLVGGTASRDSLEEDGERRRSSTTESHPWMILGLLASRTRHVSEDAMVLEALRVIRTLVDNDQEPPEVLYRIHEVAGTESGWLTIMQALVNSVPLEDALGPAVAELIVDNCPLPSKQDISNFLMHLRLNRHIALAGRQHPAKHRNICLMIGCFAAKLPGQIAASMLSEAVLEYLLCNLDFEETHPQVVLFAIIALEKLALTGENKRLILTRLKDFDDDTHPLLRLERLSHKDNATKCQIQFCAQWTLDNVFVRPGRPFSYEFVDNSESRAMLSQTDMSEYLKLNPAGLMARNDSNSFESVRCTFQVDSGIWYYEVTVITTGVMQIGWATKNSKFLNHDGFGIGDDEFSIAYDGCRQLIWHCAQCDHHFHPPWRAGDVLGCLLDLTRYKVIFSLNGSPLRPYSQMFKRVRNGFFAAASFMTYQQCEFNFGQRPFRYPPRDYEHFQTFNQAGSLSPEQRVVLPRPKRHEQRKLTVATDSCALCCDAPANVQLEPCHHQGLCRKCADLLEICPICRRTILARIPLKVGA
ncbi:RING finger and SPRY domain-containing protein 1-like [Paramacrobiotus metropolitanus]|uniref:RING finger and SPRY domain-containing protein 1-like n=1 Tax=Paramacrobiotus metropolitanus TaxID=2943436 RepID=UPI002445DA39|nr:RING finger and SPRY domain-containing protein 1-like [Paramacrobiotus metropolitanus]